MAIPVRMAARVPTIWIYQTMYATAILTSQEGIVKLPLTTVHCPLQTVTVEAVWMVSEPSPVNAIQDSREISAVLM